MARTREILETPRVRYVIDSPVGLPAVTEGINARLARGVKILGMPILFRMPGANNAGMRWVSGRVFKRKRGTIFGLALLFVSSGLIRNRLHP